MKAARNDIALSVYLPACTTSPEKIPVTYTIGGKTYRGFPADLSPKVTRRRIDSAISEAIYTATTPEGLSLRAECIEYRDYAVTDWVMYITNDGAAFGSFSEHRWVFMTLSTIMLIGLVVLLIIWDRPKPTFYIGTSMAIGGGIGNMIDRIAYGTVVDFIDFCAFPELWMWIFNGADSFVCVGAVLLVIYYITDFAATSVKTHKTAAEVAAAEHEESTLGESFSDTEDENGGEEK